MGPNTCKVGDLVYIFKGGDVPFLLRRTSSDNSLRLVGGCYIDEMMEGEALSLEGVKEEWGFHSVDTSLSTVCAFRTG